MQITRPDYYKEFSCIAGACPDTCCAGWQIVIDEKSLKKYQHLKGPFRNRLHNDINWKEHVFRQYNRRCAFLNDDNLCDIYSEAGKRMLCDTCRKYPRHIEEFEGLREYSLSLSCPEAARILLCKKEKTHFQTAQVPSEEENYEVFDYLLFTALEDTRDYLLEVIQNRQIPMRLRMWKLLAAASDFQLCLDRNELFKWEEIRERHLASGFGEEFTTKVQKRMNQTASSHQLLKEMWQAFIPKMEVLCFGWHEFLKETLSTLYYNAAEENTSSANSNPLYQEHLADFSQAYPDWNIQEEQLLVYWIYTYFCGAVYDGEIFAKVKMAVVCTLLIHELDVGTYLKNGRVFCLEDQISICYRFSRELEHSDLNLNAFEDLLAADKLFSLENMLRIC
nr:flagellin lysine-N-methylase [uncultured Blautia sp.]